MKLRQKLAAVMAAAMVVTSVPVVTMAASTNALTKETIKVEKNDSFETVATANAVSITFKDNTGSSEVFYLELTNSKWDADLLAADGSGFTDNGDGTYTYTSGAATVKYTPQSSNKIMKVEVSGIDAAESVKLPLLTTLTGGDATVKVVSKGGSTTITSGSSFVYATTSEAKVSASVSGKVNSFYKSGEIATLSLEESYTGAILNNGGKLEFTIELDDTDYRFTAASASDITIKGLYGFSSLGTLSSSDYTITNKGNELVVSIDLSSRAESITQDSIGVFEVSGVKVKTSVKAPTTGDFLVDVTGNTLSSKLTNAVVAKIAEYGTFIEMKDEKVVDVIAGRTETIEFTIGEIIEDSLVGNREFEISLDNGTVDYKELLENYYVGGSSALLEDVKEIAGDNATFADLTNKQIRKLSAKLDLDALKNAGVITDENNAVESIEFATTSSGAIDPTKLIVSLNSDIQSNVDEIDFALPIAIPVAQKDAESITISASGRALESEVSVKAVNIVNPFDVKAEALTVKVGLQKQVGGKITLTETAKEMIQKGDIVFEIVNADTGITFAGNVTLSTSGGVKGTKITTKDNTTTVTLNRTSKEAADITVEDFVLTVDRTVPEGSYDLVISGNAIDAYTDGDITNGYGNYLTVEDFIVVGTPNTEDAVGANGLAKGTSVFKVGESKYTVNGVEKTMDAQSFIQNPGYTMVPVRYVAEAFGVGGQDILFSSGVVTIFAGNRTIQLTNGSDIAVVNGAQIKMGAKMVIKDGRTYAPVGEIARILGISTSWDNETKTATFTNK